MRTALFSADDENNCQTACCRAAINKVPTSGQQRASSSALLGTAAKEQQKDVATVSVHENKRKAKHGLSDPAPIFSSCFIFLILIVFFSSRPSRPFTFIFLATVFFLIMFFFGSTPDPNFFWEPHTSPPPSHLPTTLPPTNPPTCHPSSYQPTYLPHAIDLLLHSPLSLDLQNQGEFQRL